MTVRIRLLPIFPLNTVLFPGVPLPLHIFEDRYRRMISACLASDRRFGVSLIREGQEVGGPAVPFEIGTVAEIRDLERLPDGRMNLVALGVERFRILRLVEDNPYLVGEVNLIAGQEELVEPHLVEQVSRAFANLIRETRAANIADRLTLVDEPEALSYQIAATLGIPAEIRQALLEMDSTATRLRRLRALIVRASQALRLLAGARDDRRVGPFSLN